MSILFKSPEEANSGIPSLSVLVSANTKRVETIKDIVEVIRKKEIRGAPVIATVACLGFAMDLKHNLKNDNYSFADVIKYVQDKMTFLKTSLPTTVNLFSAMDELEKILNKQITATAKSSSPPSKFRDEVVVHFMEHGKKMLKRFEDNIKIGENLAGLIKSNVTPPSGANLVPLSPAAANNNTPPTSNSVTLSSSTAATNSIPDDGTATATSGDADTENGLRIVTICDTELLNTALEVVRSLHSTNDLAALYCLETRPYHQASRLTAFEIKEDSLPGATFICDSAVGALMNKGIIDACVVGADLVYDNGDVLNKIGTYNLAVIAKAHSVPFYVAGPSRIKDPTSKFKVDIKERLGDKMIDWSKAPEGMNYWNPIFDVTPAKLITKIIIREDSDVIGFVNLSEVPERGANETRGEKRGNETS